MVLYTRVGNMLVLSPIAPYSTPRGLTLSAYQLTVGQLVCTARMATVHLLVGTNCNSSIQMRISGKRIYSLFREHGRNIQVMAITYSLIRLCCLPTIYLIEYLSLPPHAILLQYKLQFFSLRVQRMISNTMPRKTNDVCEREADD
jgi:hypothetical protein